MSDALHSMDMAFSFLSDLFRGIWQWVVDSPIVFLSLLAFLFVVVLGWLITLVQSAVNLDSPSSRKLMFGWGKKKDMPLISKSKYQIFDIDGQQFYRRKKRGFYSRKKQSCKKD